VNTVRMVLIIVDAVVAVTAVGGGIVLAAGLEGGWYPAGWLRGTPFGSYLIPGLTLAVVVGGSAAAAAALTFTAPVRGAWVSMLAGVILMGQIAGEIRLLRQPVTGMETAYFAAGLAMVALGLTLGGVAVGRVSFCPGGPGSLGQGGRRPGTGGRPVTRR
jgi:hypothetical protein